MKIRSHILFLFNVLMVCMIFSCGHTDWRFADNSSAGIAPLPENEPAALVQVYGARAINWRGYFSLHCWIAVKEANADHFVTYHVMGFRLNRTGTSVVVQKDIPDRKWYGAEPELIHEIKGPAAERAIRRINELVESYPNAKIYRAWPGPNSNTFISYLIRHTPELGVELPSNAIGKDWIDEGDLVGFSQTGTGVQFSAYGLFGMTVGLADGLEFNILGLNLGVDIWTPALKLPMIGRIGFRDRSWRQSEYH